MGLGLEHVDQPVATGLRQLEQLFTSAPRHGRLARLVKLPDDIGLDPAEPEMATAVFDMLVGRIVGEGRLDQSLVRLGLALLQPAPFISAQQQIGFEDRDRRAGLLDMAIAAF